MVQPVHAAILQQFNPMHGLLAQALDALEHLFQVPPKPYSPGVSTSSTPLMNIISQWCAFTITLSFISNLQQWLQTY